MRVDPAEFRALDLRCHALLAEVPLHDVWSLDLAGGGAGRTMEDVLAASPFGRGGAQNLVVRWLFALRQAAGQLLGWDDARHDPADGSYLHALTDDDRKRSLLEPGAKVGGFRFLYVFPQEAVAEIRNATVHAFLAMALRPAPSGYTLYWAIYVKPVSALTGLYMALIDPFRRWIVYPTLIGEMQEAWSRADLARCALRFTARPP